MTINPIQIDYTRIEENAAVIQNKEKGGKQLSKADEMIFAIRDNKLIPINRGGFFKRLWRAIFHRHDTYDQGKVLEILKNRFGLVIGTAHLTSPQAPRSEKDDINDIFFLLNRQELREHSLSASRDISHHIE